MQNKCEVSGVIVTLTANDNYGCIIQRWALQKFLEENGFLFDSYYFNSYFFHAFLPKTVFQWRLYAKAALRPFKRLITGMRPLFEIDKTLSLRKMKWTSNFTKTRIRQKRFFINKTHRYKTYIVGSDQVWRDWGNSRYFNVMRFFLDFVKNPNAKRIAYAVSFGQEGVESKNFKNKAEQIKKLISKFDAISVREESKIRLVKETWEVDAVHVLDPTFLLDAGEYSKLINDPVCALEQTHPLFCYLLGPSEIKTEIVCTLANRMGCKTSKIYPYGHDILPPVEQWLKGFRDCNFVVTDSFHATVFSIINRKPFIVFTNQKRGIARLTNLLCALGLEDRMIPEEELMSFNFSKLGDIDYDQVHAKLAGLREFSSNWLLTQLRTPKF